MRLLEYEAKKILAKAGLIVPAGFILPSDSDLSKTHVDLHYPVVVKSQVPIGGRGKAGGVQIVTHHDDLRSTCSNIARLKIGDHLPTNLLIEPKLDIIREHYLSLVINRDTALIQLIAHKNGGVEVETNKNFYREDITLNTSGSVAQKITNFFEDTDVHQLEKIIRNLFACFVENDMLLLEINPLVMTTSGTYICADAKVELDDAAAFRHPDWHFEDKPSEVNFVTLDQNGMVATIANGAGLAMATVDAVASAGMRPANFLDVGGGANKDSVLQAFKRIMEYPHIKAIVINIFAGITRCDEVAQAIITARHEINNLPPLFIRLAGTKFEAAATLLEQQQIPTLTTLEACLEAVKQQVNE